jgi:hypothetical protein
MTVITNHTAVYIARIGLISTSFVAAAAITSAPLGLALLAGIVHTVAFSLLQDRALASKNSKLIAVSGFTMQSSRLALFFALGIFSSNPVSTLYALNSFLAFSYTASLIEPAKTKPSHA